MTCRSWSIDLGGARQGEARQGAAGRGVAVLSKFMRVVVCAALPRLMMGKALNPADIKTI